MSNSNNFYTVYNEYLETIVKRVRAAVEKAKEDAFADFLVVAEDRIRTIFNSVIQDFYASYSPKHYDRTESLYNLLQITTTRDTLSGEFNSDMMSSFRNGYSGDDGLYDQVFRHGWHGGAGSGDGHPDPGRPYWRTPVPYYNRWGHEAAMSDISPLEDFNRRLSDYEKYEMQSDYDMIFSTHINNIKID